MGENGWRAGDETTLTRTSSRHATCQAEARLKKLQQELRRREDADRAKSRRVIPPSQLNHKHACSSANQENPKPHSPATPPKSSKPEPKPPVDDDDSEEEAPRPQQQQQQRPPVVAEVPDEATELKKAGNEALEEGDYELAAQLYTEALQDESGVNRKLDATVAAALYNNRALARLKLQQWLAASVDAAAAVSLRPEWHKPCFRLAQAQCELGAFKQAIATCRMGERLLEKAGDHSRAFEPLMDRITHVAALAGSLAGFDGHVLEVRSAGEDAWLCKPAPSDPLIDHPDEADDDTAMTTLSVLRNDAVGTAGAPTGAALVEAANLAVAKLKEHERALAAGSKPRSYRRLKDALADAKDGDRILMLRGIHNFSGETCEVKKRVLIKGEGELREMMVDQRSNSPSLRLLRTCVIQNMEIDMSGFRECVCVQGAATVRPVVDHCIFRCSGDDAINVAGAAVPTVRDCEFIGRKCGLKVMDMARGEFIDCKFNTCNRQGVRAHDQARPTLRRCHIEGNIEEGVVVMDRAHVELVDCHIRDNKGPGIDLSDQGSVTLRNCYVKNNTGGIFMWDESRASLFGVRINGGLSHAIVADGDASLRMKSCTVHGVVQATDPAWAGIRNGTNQLVEPDEPTQLPAEEGCFKFEADRFTRKQ